MKIEIGMDEFNVDEYVKCRECGEMVIGKVYRVYFIVGEVTDIEYTKYYVCEACKWETDNPQEND